MALWKLSLTWVFSWILVLGALGYVAAKLIIRLLAVSQNTPVPKWRLNQSPIHLLVVLGSGGHTAEMFSMLRRMQLDPSKYTYRTYVLSSGDNFSAAKAVEFETALLKQRKLKPSTDGQTTESESGGAYTIVTVPRARRVHQSYFTSPFTTLQSFWSCLLVLRGLHPDQQAASSKLPSPYPDLILTNGPATAVCVVLAARILRLYQSCVMALFPSKVYPHARSLADPRSGRNAPLSGDLRLRTIFVESWARVTTLSLSGKLLLPLVDRFLVQWPALEGKRAWRGMRKTEYVGTLMD
ncbi:hypothetical protein P175DRAFT_0558835 [Aspergillus ochraceoroseus IBT 24754]|uniref:UDP-N-acetylglucosamine transferase subunit ALG14 n=1 Tax=Aspergillus ochraceoroseus IBT 24754 TaxID=1392256 RepID=A0A2T5LSM5_9EURO|nr:uncharacterized protein P175DRAFT_0558835 [Aspergillus ochraceoroseus IBT 24754]PTU19271.1 hypothetical protein P175DRAFT_0558835 [Aspergillus ochraceoroseus IBT 24754]